MQRLYINVKLVAGRPISCYYLKFVRIDVHLGMPMARRRTHISITELILYYLLELFDRRIA